MLNTREKKRSIFSLSFTCVFLITSKILWCPGTKKAYMINQKAKHCECQRPVCCVSFIYSKLFKYGIMTLSRPEKPLSSVPNSIRFNFNGSKLKIHWPVGLSGTTWNIREWWWWIKITFGPRNDTFGYSYRYFFIFIQKKHFPNERSAMWIVPTGHMQRNMLAPSNRVVSFWYCRCKRYFNTWDHLRSNEVRSRLRN